MDNKLIAPAQPASKTGATDKSLMESPHVNNSTGSSLLEGYAPVLKISEGAEILRVKRATLRDMCRTGAIPSAFKVGAEWRLTRTGLEQYIMRGGSCD